MIEGIGHEGYFLILLLLLLRFLLLKQLLAIFELFFPTPSPIGVVKPVICGVCYVCDGLIFHGHFVKLLDLRSLVDVGYYQKFVRAKHLQGVGRRRVVKILIFFIFRIALLLFIIDVLYIFFLFMFLSLLILFFRVRIIIIFVFFLGATQRFLFIFFANKLRGGRFQLERLQTTGHFLRGLL